MRALHTLYMTAAAIALAVIALPALAQQAPRIRGEIIAIGGTNITVKTPEGKTIDVALDPKFTVNHTIKATLADIKPGDFVGTGAYPFGDGWKAAEIHIFPKGSRQGEGHRPWSSDPTGTMTNAEVTASVVGASKDQLTLTTNGNSYKITVTPETPIVRFTEGTQGLVRKGAWVGISNAVPDDMTGKLTAKSITVSDDKRYPVN